MTEAFAPSPSRSDSADRPDWPADLLLMLAAHAARQVGARDAAVCAWPADDDRPDVSRASTSIDPDWLEALAALADGALPPPATPSRCRRAGRALAVVGFTVAGRHGLLAVGGPDAEDFAAADLALLGDVGGLVVAALRDRPRPAADAREPARPPLERPTAAAGGFHHRLPRSFARLEAMPALVQSRDVLLGLLDAPSPPSAAIVTAIESDVALLIAVLRLANREAGGRKASIWSVPEAVEVLAPEGVETMARRMTVFDFFQRIRGWDVPPEHFRLHAVSTQRAAQRLARLVDHREPDQLMVAALLHDVGKLVLMDAYSGYPGTVLAGTSTPAERLQAERRALGLDHQMAGGVLLRRWRLPERLAEIVGRHHGGDGDDREAALIGLADMVAHYAQGQPVSPGALDRSAASVGVSASQLRTVMYELSQPSEATVRSTDPTPLSSRETQVLRGLSRGLTYSQIAIEVGLAASTVRTHLHNVYKKLGVIDRAQAVIEATARGWI